MAEPGHQLQRGGQSRIRSWLTNTSIHRSSLARQRRSADDPRCTRSWRRDRHGGRCGLGRAIALRIAGGGGTVVVADRDFDAANAVQAEISSAGGSALAVCTDVTSQASLDEMVRTALAEYGRIDSLINNAGMLGPIKPFWETTDEDVQRGTPS